MDRLVSHCRHCRFYTPEGRRGGQCSQLGVSVSGSWQSCNLSLAPFAPSWESPELFPITHRGQFGEATSVPRPKLPTSDATPLPRSADLESWGAIDSKLVPVP